MARRKSKMTVGAKYVAIGALTEALTMLMDPEVGDEYLTETPEKIAASLVDRAWDVEHFPVAGKVQITLDLGRLDQPADPVAGRDYEPNATP